MPRLCLACCMYNLNFPCALSIFIRQVVDYLEGITLSWPNVITGHISSMRWDNCRSLTQFDSCGVNRTDRPTDRPFRRLRNKRTLCTNVILIDVVHNRCTLAIVYDLHSWIYVCFVDGGVWCAAHDNTIIDYICFSVRPQINDYFVLMRAYLLRN